MAKEITIENEIISNLYSFLMKTKYDTIIIRTSMVKGGWHDNELDANCAGFNIYRFINPEYEANYTFPQCYKITRNVKR